ncbi:glutathione S-transferase family protein [Pararoseomonas baculiformis]|uniref:glutathione S-transferase family protein n=1 Tax=Pararoseomonas baculiformis TaxID=2820812 RepID=UPI001FD7871C|nr:glutathione S-transferase family protein [Pararoseomonas baculiformis]
MGGLLIWGRANSVNVQKVLWCCGELGLPFERREAGLHFGMVNSPEYRAMNPNGRVPTLVDGDVVLWESNSILRYLALREIERRPDSQARHLYPAGAAPRARMERWMDWTLSTMQPAERPLFWGLVRTRPEDRDMAAITAAAKATGNAWKIVDAHLAHGRDYLEGDDFTLADITLGSYVRRWFSMEIESRPDLPRLRRWHDRLSARPAFQSQIAGPLS